MDKEKIKSDLESFGCPESDIDRELEGRLIDPLMFALGILSDAQYELEIGNFDKNSKKAWQFINKAKHAIIKEMENDIERRKEMFIAKLRHD